MESSQISYSTDDTIEITIPSSDERFTEVSDFLSIRNKGWGQPFSTFPTPQYTIRFIGVEDELVFPLWIGVNWIGVRYKGKSYSKTLTQSELKTLKDLLGIQSEE